VINKDKIFELFNEVAENSDGKSKLKPVDDFMETPFAKIGMFTKLVLNHFVFHEKLERFLKKEQPTYDAQSTREASDFTVFNRAWFYISQIDIDENSHLKAIVQFNPVTFKKALQSAIWYFESQEHYEKCAHLLKIQKLVKEI